MIIVDGIWLGTTRLSVVDVTGLSDGTCAWVSTVKRMNLGTMYFYNIAATALRVGRTSSVEINQTRGSGNAGLLIDVTEPGCLAYAPGGSMYEWQATTSAAHAYRVCGTEYDHVDLPVFISAKAAGLAG